MKNKKEIQEKPLAYLDHNVLDLFTEPKNLLSRDSDLFQILKNDVQAVYSPITLEEIYRSVVKGKSSVYGLAFLEVLGALDAHYIELTTDKNGILSNTILRSWESPLTHFNRYIENNYLNKHIDSLKKNIFALYGGVKDFNMFEKEQIENLNNLLFFLEESLMNLENSEYKDDYILSEIEKYKVEIPKLRSRQKQYEESVSISRQHLEELNKEKYAHLNFRDKLNINIDNLKKIQPPNVLHQIWRLLKENNLELESVEMDDFFQLKQKRINSENEYYVFEKVNQIYTMLNLIGFYSDSGLHKEKRFIASFSDMSHASYACFCEYLFTRDEDFSNKTQVAYEYLGVTTKIYLI
ncbi:hypothetical protein [Acinetobacter modestus]|uniref:PIN like domain-containing protein n=1 Tax=Acinetobacter modestus TaxID=1776740 RepID=A0ABN0JL46_9GAMM|nr:hypothetical protein [Acinetobacter modestus]ENU26022.1 hypothetical protein F992_02891 [Acinetobacter modestus]GGA28436.1 hypothetical protein GCM10017554_26950 [Acinetobacter modestus]